jgi:hypothetical protein
MLGISSLTVTQADLEWLQKAIERAPEEAVAVNVEKQGVRFRDRVMTVGPDLELATRNRTTNRHGNRNWNRQWRASYVV